jgi:antitoxin component YwqK of YwqJK toxin-antitoxin module
MANGIREGEYKEYHENGQLWVICNYIDGKIEGELKSYHNNGQLEAICNYIDGVKSIYL